MAIKAVGFDLDGTLVNTHVNYVDLNDVNRFVLEPLGFPVDEIWADRNITSRQPFYDWMVHHGRKAEIPRFDKLLDDRCLEVERLGMAGSNVYSGIMDTLEWLKDSGYRLGVVTRGGHSYAVDVLGEYGMLGFFDVIHGRDDFGYSDAKPSPKAMVHLAEALGVGLDELLYVGDSPTDFESADAAGVEYAGVMTGKGSTELWSSMSDRIHIIASAAEVRGLLEGTLRS